MIDYRNKLLFCRVKCNNNMKLNRIKTVLEEKVAEPQKGEQQ